MAILLPATQPTGDPPGCLAGIGTARFHSLDTRRALSVKKDPGTESRQYRRCQLCGRFQEGLAYQLLVRGKLRSPGRCNAGRVSRPPPGKVTTWPAKCDHKESRPDAAATRLALA